MAFSISAVSAANTTTVDANSIIKSSDTVKNYVETSEVDLGIVYKSDSLDLKSSQVVLEIPKNLHENINYTLAPINSSEDGKKIIEFINSKYSKKISTSFGSKCFPLSSLKRLKILSSSQAFL